MDLKKELTECDNLYEKQDFEGLIERCDGILEKYPDNQNAMGYKGISLYFLGEYDGALEILERGVELYPDNYYLKNNLAMVYYEMGDYETSLRLCEEGLKLKDFDWLCENKFRTLIMLGRYDEAIDFEKTVNQDLFLHSIFMQDGMAEHELKYYCCLLRDSPDDFYVIDMIKMACDKLGRTPELGDYHLKWIDAVRYLDDRTEVCPVCGGELVSIVWGMPGTDLLEKAQRGEVYLAGCCVPENPHNCHCRGCERDFSIGNGEVSVIFENPEIEEYATFKMFLMSRILKNSSKECITEAVIKDDVMLFGGELDAFVSHLIEIGYICRSGEGCIKPAR